MDIRCDYDDVAKVWGPRSTSVWWEIRTNWRQAIDTWSLPSRVTKILLTPSLKIPCGVYAHLLHTKSSVDTEPLQGKGLPGAGASGFAREHNRWAQGWAGPWQHCYLEGATSLFCQLLKIEIRFIGQALPTFLRCPCSTASALFWQPPARSCW
jgi:hypothetical protein